jgi:NTE family protein
MSGTPRSAPRIALALGGGSARGLAHILMLEAFDELGVKPSIIAGTSIGSICGAAFAAGLSAAEIRAEFEGLLRNRAAFFGRVAGGLRGELATFWRLRAPSVIDNTTLFEILLPEPLHRDFASLKIPFVAVATDFYGIQQVELDHGPLIPALAASCSLPGLSRPVVLEGRLLIDGGYINPVPYDVVMHRADITVAVDVTGDPKRRPGARAPKAFALLTGATQILFHSITREKLKSVAPDIFIRPAVGGFAAMDYFRIGEILAAAEDAKQDLKRQLAALLERA